LVRGETYHVLSVIQPWAWALVFAGKEVENRSRRTSHRGRLLIHAPATRRSAADIAEARKRIARCARVDLDQIPEDFGYSQILGSVELVDCREGVRSRWAQADQKHWILESPRRLVTPVDEVRGRRNVWTWTA
jgi:hypothetical protein